MQGASSAVHKLWITSLITTILLAGWVGAAWAQGPAVDVAFLAPRPVADPVVAAASDEGIYIQSIQVVGLKRLDESIVLSGLTIKAGDVLVGNAKVKLDSAAEALFNTGWFSATPEMALDSGESGAILKVTVVENPLYNSTRISGNTLFSSERLLQEANGKLNAEGVLEGARLIPGQVINVKKIYAVTDAIKQVYADAGYVAAGVANWSLVPASENSEDAILDIKFAEGLIEEILITGLDKTKERVVRGRVTHMRPGRVLTSNDLQRDLEQIYNTGLFEEVRPGIEPSLKEGYVKIVLEVVESKTGQVGFGLGYSTVNGLQGQIEYNERNLFGTGKQVTATVVFSTNKPGYSLTYADPFFTDTSFWSVGVFSLHNRQQRNPGQPYESEIGIDSQGISLGYGQHLSDYDTWQTSFGLTDYDYTVRKGDPFHGYNQRQRARLSAEGQTRKLGLSYNRDTRDNIFSTTQGYLAKVTGEFAGFGGDFNFNKYTFEGREFYRLGPGSLGFRQILGTSTGNLPIYEEYRVGGTNSVRGVSEDLYYGRQTFLSNIEYRLKINDTFGAVAFFDAGWAGSSWSTMDHAAGAGVGARLNLPMLGIGAVRLDYGWRIAGDDTQNARFHFFLGEMF